MVIMDEPYALLLLVTNVMGTGVLGSVHMAQRKAQSEFQQQMVQIVSAQENIPFMWALVGDDWNRDIRVDKHMQVILYRMQMTVAAMGNEVDLPKDFIVVYGILGPKVILAQESGGSPSGMAPRLAQSYWLAHRGVDETGYSCAVARTVKTMFSNVLEALSQGCSDSALWLHLYREWVCLGNLLVEGVERSNKLVMGRQNFRDILKDMQIVVTGQGWAHADKREQRQSEAY